MLYQFYVVEIKKLRSGEFEHNVTWHWDTDATKAQLKAESKFHEILSAAAISDTLEHSAIIFSTEGFPLAHQCYKHDVAPVEVTNE